MSTHRDDLAQKSSGKEKPKQKQSVYKHIMGNNAKEAVEKAMTHADKIREQAHALLDIRAAAATQLAELRAELTGFSKLDHRVPLWETKILKAELNLAGIDTAVAIIIHESAAITSELGHTLATRRIERPEMRGGRRDKQDIQDNQGNGQADEAPPDWGGP